MAGNINDSRRESFQEFGGKVGQNAIITRGDTWAPPVSSVGDLPLSGNNLGDIRQTLDNGTLYRWNGSAWNSYINEMVISNVTSSVNPAVPQTAYICDASSGTITITLPNSTLGDTSEYRIVLSKNTNPVRVTTINGTQLIGTLTTQYISTVGGEIYVKSNGTGYTILTDTREYFRHIDITTDINLSTSGYESGTVYHCIPSGGTITVTIPDSSVECNGTWSTFAIHGAGTVIVKTTTGQLIEGLAEQSMTNGAFQLVCLGDHYVILQDSRPKVQTSSITLFSLNELSTVSDGIGGFYRQSCTTTSDPRYSATSTVVNSGTIGIDTYLFGYVSDAGVVQGTLPEGPVVSTINIGRNTGIASFRVYAKYYKITSGLVKTLIGTSSLSNVIDTSTIAGFNVNTTIVQTIFSSTDRVLREVWATSSGSPTAKFYVEGSAPSFSTFSVPSTTISHNSIAGLQLAGAGITYGHVNDQAQTIYGAKTFNSTIIGNISGNASTVSATAFSILNLPEGTMINGKIVPSVASGHLTVALKTLAGTDATPANPIYVMIGGVVRTITGALTMTINAGANYFNAGSNELATKEIDYFSYLTYNVAYGVGIIVSRLPYGKVWGDFVSSETNFQSEKYGARIVTTPVSTDPVVNIGRFAATLSAGAGYTWSVPTFTASNLVQRPIYETRNVNNNYVGALTWVGGTAPTGGTSVSTEYQLIGNKCYIRGSGYNYSTGINITGLNVSLPFTAFGGVQSIFLIPSHIGVNDTPNVSYGEINYQSNTLLEIKCASCSAGYFNFQGWYYI